MILHRLRRCKNPFDQTSQSRMTLRRVHHTWRICCRSTVLDWQNNWIIDACHIRQTQPQTRTAYNKEILQLIFTLFYYFAPLFSKHTQHHSFSSIYINHLFNFPPPCITSNFHHRLMPGHNMKEFRYTTGHIGGIIIATRRRPDSIVSMPIKQHRWRRNLLLHPPSSPSPCPCQMQYLAKSTSSTSTCISFPWFNSSISSYTTPRLYGANMCSFPWCLLPLVWFFRKRFVIVLESGLTCEWR